MDPYVGEIRLFAGDYAPAGWALCQGQLMQVWENQALFSIIGNTFGGDGQKTFQLPDLRGVAVMHQGTAGPGLTKRLYASSGGALEVTLTGRQLPTHGHVPLVYTTSTVSSPDGSTWASTQGGKSAKRVYSSLDDTSLHPNVLDSVGGNMPHNNVQPYIVMNYIIALVGVYPSKP
jgi:Microcystin-dependent protein